MAVETSEAKDTPSQPMAWRQNVVETLNEMLLLPNTACHPRNGSESPTRIYSSGRCNL
jgi:hypothetical protein